MGGSSSKGGGGGCQERSPIRASVNPNDQINQIKTISQGCGPMGTVKNHLHRYIPQNGEYAWAGEGPVCHYVGVDAGKEMTCSAGCSAAFRCAIVGKRGTYKRVAYKGDERRCCTERPSSRMINGKTCHPNTQNMTSNTCKPHIERICRQGENIFNNTLCKNYCIANGAFCNAVKSGYCNDINNISKPNCKKWCDSNVNACKNAIENYCRQTNRVFTDAKCRDYCASNQAWCKGIKTNFCNNPANFGSPECHNFCTNDHAACRTTIENHCRTNSNIFNKPICQNYCAKNKSWCDDIKSKHCNTPANTSSETCQTWCKSASGMGKCDGGMINFCNVVDNKDKNICKCVNSSIAKKKGKFNPLCIDAKCASVGYATQPMLEGSRGGCMITDCTQYVDLKDIAAAEVQMTTEFQQSCGAYLENEKKKEEDEKRLEEERKRQEEERRRLEEEQKQEPVGAEENEAEPKPAEVPKPEQEQPQQPRGEELQLPREEQPQQPDVKVTTKDDQIMGVQKPMFFGGISSVVLLLAVIIILIFLLARK